MRNSPDPSGAESANRAIGRADSGAFDAIVLAGGAARRLGGADKALQTVGRLPMLELVLSAVSDARRRVVVGPRRNGLSVPDPIWAREEPAGSGPACAIAAGAVATSADQVLVLAADMPFIAGAIEPLRAALAAQPEADVAVLSRDGRHGYLAAAWRRPALIAALTARPPQPGDSARSLYRAARSVVVPDAAGWSRDCDTWEELAQARQAAQDASRG